MHKTFQCKKKRQPFKEQVMDILELSLFTLYEDLLSSHNGGIWEDHGTTFKGDLNGMKCI